MAQSCNYRILVAEDDSCFRQLLYLLINHYFPDVQITLVNDGAAAIAAHTASPADLIITDNQMPMMKGVELIRYLQSRHDQTPIILCTLDEINDLGLANTTSQVVSKTDASTILPGLLAMLIQAKTHTLCLQKGA